MRYFLLSFCFGLTGLVYTQSFDLCKIIESESKAASYKLNHKANLATLNYDVNFHRLELEIDPTVKYIKGKVTTYFTTKEVLNQIVFDLSDSLEVDSIIHKGIGLSFNRNISNTISADLSLAKDISDSITIYYKGVPNTNGLGSFTQGSHSGDSIIWTLSQPYGAQEWWPCKNSLTDKIDSVEIHLTSPLKYKTASNGLLKSIDTLGSSHVFRWKTTYPIPSYLVAISVANYEIYENKMKVGNDSLLLNHYLFPDQSLADSENGLQSFFHLFDSLFGQYPFIKEKYGHASFVRAGGMEHQTMSFMGNYGGELKAHELAHQWFGNKVTCGSWTDLWLNEGFATYLTLLTYEFPTAHDPLFYEAYLNGIRAASFNYPKGSVYRGDTTQVSELFNNLAYSKGACLLHMLRWKIGDQAFFRAVRNYLDDPKLTFSFASTNDLKEHLENTSNQNLDEFFSDWFYGKGYPNYSTTWSQAADKLLLSINQQATDPSVYFFDIPLPFQLLGPNLDTTIIVNPSFNNQLLTIRLDQKVDSVIFDPDKWVLGKNNVRVGLKPSELTKNEFKVYPNPLEQGQQLNFKTNALIEQISILTIKGQFIKSYQDATAISTDFLESGTYLLKIVSTSSIFYRRIVIK